MADDVQHKMGSVPYYWKSEEMIKWGTVDGMFFFNIDFVLNWIFHPSSLKECQDKIQTLNM